MSSKRLLPPDHTGAAELPSDLPTLTIRAVQLCESYSRRGAVVSNGDIERTLHHLKSSRLRSQQSAGVFRENGGIEALLNISGKLQPGVDSDCKTLTIVWGTLANLCALEEQCRDKCVDCATSMMCRLLTECSSPHVLNTVARAVGNIVSSSRFLSVSKGDVFVMVRELTRIVSVQGDIGCLQSSLRAMRLLGADGALREEMKLCETLTIIAARCLREETQMPVLSAALHTLEQLVVGSSCSSPELLATLWSSGNELLSRISGYVYHSEHSLRQRAVSILCECAQHCDGKPALSRAGGIEALVKMLSDKTADEQMLPQVVSSLCLCCRDVHSRQKMRDCGGLSILIDMLRDDQLVALHSDILSALVCYYFDENTLRFMVRCLGLLRSLVHQLASMAAKAKELNQALAVSQEKEELGVAAMESMGTPNSLVMELAEVGSGACLGVDDDDVTRPVDVGCSGCSSPVCSDFNSPSVSSIHWQSSHSRSSSPKLLSSPGSSNLSDQENLSPCLSPSNGSSSPPVVSQTSQLSQSCTVDLPVPLPESAVGSASPLSSSCSPTYRHSLSLPDEASLQEWCNSLSSPPHSLSSSFSFTKPKVQLDHTPMPTNFIDSLLSSPTYYQPSNTQTPKTDFTSSITDPKNTADTKTRLLLSRVSHLRDCLPCLANADFLPVILDYFFATGTADIHCFKVLSRVYSNPHCFQDCVLNLAPSLILDHMNNLAASSSAQSVSNSENNVSCATPASPSYTFSEEPSAAFNTHQDACQQLFSKLSHVAESPYGQGVIAHLLLRGDNRETNAGALSLTLLQKSPSTCRRMLLMYGGLHYLISMIEGDQQSLEGTDMSETREGIEKDKENVEVKVCVDEVAQSMAIAALLSLAQNLSKNPSLKRQLSGRKSTAEQYHSVMPSPLPPSKRQRSESFEPTLATTETVFSFLPQPPLSPAYCRYMDSDHTPFDLVIATSYEESQGSFAVHRSQLMENSQVFNVMLGGVYQEALSEQVHLKGVVPSAFESLLHHIYGCSWNCVGRRLRNHPEKTRTYSDEVEVMFASAFPSPVSPTTSQEEGGLMLHCLEVLACANQFFVASLIAQCELRLTASISLTNLVPLFIFSQLHGSERLARSCITHLVNMPSSSHQRDLFKQLLESSDCSCKCLRIIEEMFQK